MTARASLIQERERLTARLRSAKPRSERRQVLLAELQRVTTRLIKAELRPRRPAAT
jgi:hypothetical protein